MKNDAERARLAANLLNNPLLDESLILLREAYVNAFISCAPGDGEGRWRYASAVRGLAFIKGHIQSVVQTGLIGQQEIAQLQEMETRDNVFKRAVRGFFSDDASSEKPN